VNERGACLLGAWGFDDGTAAMHHEKPLRSDRAAIITASQDLQAP
jgi:hypothetical protein